MKKKTGNIKYDSEINVDRKVDWMFTLKQNSAGH